MKLIDLISIVTLELKDDDDIISIEICHRQGGTYINITFRDEDGETCEMTLKE